MHLQPPFCYPIHPHPPLTPFVHRCPEAGQLHIPWPVISYGVHCFQPRLRWGWDGGLTWGEGWGELPQEEKKQGEEGGRKEKLKNIYVWIYCMCFHTSSHSHSLLCWDSQSADQVQCKRWIELSLCANKLYIYIYHFLFSFELHQCPNLSPKFIGSDSKLEECKHFLLI